MACLVPGLPTTSSSQAWVGNRLTEASQTHPYGGSTRDRNTPASVRRLKSLVLQDTRYPSIRDGLRALALAHVRQRKSSLSHRRILSPLARARSLQGQSTCCLLGSAASNPVRACGTGHRGTSAAGHAHPLNRDSIRRGQSTIYRGRTASSPTAGTAVSRSTPLAALHEPLLSQASTRLEPNTTCHLHLEGNRERTHG